MKMNFKWIPLISLPIAASNAFGAINFYLNGSGIFIKDRQLIRGIVFIIAIIIARMANRRSQPGVILAFIILALGTLSSIWGMYLGLQYKSFVALGLAAMWFLVFSFSLYLTKKHLM